MIVNFPRTQFASLFRFVDEAEEKRARSFMSMVQLTACSVAIRISAHECIAEATSFYCKFLHFYKSSIFHQPECLFSAVEYFHAAEKALLEQRSMKAADVVHRMTDRPVANPSISKLFSSRAKRLLSRRVSAYRDHVSAAPSPTPPQTSDSSNGGDSDDSLEEEDQTVVKMAKVTECALSGTQ